MTDAPNIASRRQREKRTISQMCAIYCRGNHPGQQTEDTFCGEKVCPACAAIEKYAVDRTEHCRQMGVKINCEVCPYHCYKGDERQQIRAIMRFAGPRMVTTHPIAAIRHLMEKSLKRSPSRK